MKVLYARNQLDTYFLKANDKQSLQHLRHSVHVARFPPESVYFCREIWILSDICVFRG